MNNLFLILLLVSIVLFFIALFKPSLLKQSRKRGVLITGGSILLFFILFGVTSSPSVPVISNAKPADAVTSNTHSKAVTDAPSATPDAVQPSNPAPDAPNTADKIKATISNALSGKTNNGKDRLKDVQVMPLALTGPDGSPMYTADVEFNADDNFTGKTTGQGIEMKMADVYKAIYSTYTNVNVVHIKAYLDTTDKYGNVQNSMVYHTALNKETGSKINWNTDSATLELQIVPGLWTKILEFPFLQK